MQVWRLEDKVGNGPNVCGDPIVEDLAHKALAANPNILEEFGLEDSVPFEMLKYGFKTLEKLIEYFGYPAIVVIMKQGFHITNYQVPTERVIVSKSHAMVMFDKAHSNPSYRVTDTSKLFGFTY